MKKKFIVFFIMFVILIYSYKDKVIVGDNAILTALFRRNNIRHQSPSTSRT